MRTFRLILAVLAACAQQAVASPSLQLLPSQGNYLPDSEVTLELTANELEQVQVTAYRIDPFRQFDPAEASSMAEWVSMLDLSTMKPLLTRTVRHPNFPLYTSFDISLGRLPAGAYIVDASASNLRARALILVTGMMVVARSVGSQTLIYVCNAENGAPIAKADVRVITARYVSGRKQPYELRLRTDRRGTALLTSDTEGIYYPLSILASAGKWQAYTWGQERTDIVIIVCGGRSEDIGLWRFYLFTDLPVYQPGQTVNWRLIARWWDKETYRTPANRSLRYSIIDPQNEQMGRGEIKLNAFGSASGSVEIPEKAPPGRYHLWLYDERGRWIRTLLLCRVGALPSRLQVNLQANLIPGQADERGFRPPDSVQVRVQVTDRSGKPVSGAKVQVRLFSSGSFNGEPRPREVPWYFEFSPRYDLPGIVPWGYDIDIVESTTDSQGTATVTVPRKGGAFSGEYRIWATAETEQGDSGASFTSVLALGGRGGAFITAEKGAYEPGEPVTLHLRTVGAEYQPVAMKGVLRLRRATSAHEVWRTPWEIEVRDEEIARRLHALGVPLERVRTELAYEEVLSQPLHTDASGEASVTWRLDREGYYEVRWEQEDVPVSKRASALNSLYVIKPGSKEAINARAERTPVAVYPAGSSTGPGQRLPVLMFVQNPPRHVLLFEEGNRILRWQVLYVKRGVEVAYLPLTELHTPMFTLNAIVVEDGQAFGFTWNIVVPPRQHNLKVLVQPDKDNLWVVRTTDEQNKPVSADVSIALVNRTALSAVLRFPEPRFDRAGASQEQYIDIPTPPLSPGYPEDPRLYFALPAPFNEPSRFDTSYDVAPYVRIVRGHRVLPIPYDWRNRAWRQTFGSPSPESEVPKPPGLISGGKINQLSWVYRQPSLPKGVPNQVDEFTYAKLPYTRYVQQTLRDAVLAQLPDNGEGAPRTLLWLPQVVTDEKGTATIALPSSAGRGGVLIAVACSEGSQFGWLMQAIPPKVEAGSSPP